jgi:hypothetical protein
MQETVEHHMMPSQEHNSGIPTNTDITFEQGCSEEADIAGFLERPIKHTTLTWNVGSDLVYGFDPWRAFLSNAAVKKKLDNYHLIRGTMHVSFLINGTPQHAGLVLASYRYLSRTNEFVSIGGDTQHITRSQRPHVFLNPSLSRGGCLQLPFFWGTNYMDVNTTFDVLGLVNVDSFQPLTQLGGAVDAVTVSIMLHMTDVTLTAPTHFLAASALNMIAASSKKSSKKKIKIKKNDEYSSDGPVSSIANAVAAAAGELAKVPIIGPFAMATQIGSTAIGSIAALFGFSKPTEIRDVMVVRPTPMYSMATSDGSDGVQKLTVTRKQEITVDPTTTGLSSKEDPLAMETLGKIESYFTQFPWNVTAVPDDWLFSCSVSPNLFVVSGDMVVPTMIAYMGVPFSHWSGSIKFRFKIVASRFTRGRLAIVYDPNSLSSTALDTYNTNFTTIIDISETRDFTIEVPWMQYDPYREVDHSYVTNYWSNDGAAVSGQNGVLGVRVLNELTQPDGLTDISVNMFVSAGEDFEYVNPTGEAVRNIRFQAASGINMLAASDEGGDTEKDSEDLPVQTEDNYKIASMPDLSEQKAMIFYGERVGSLRQLVKRYCYARTEKIRNSTGGRGWDTKRFPLITPYRYLSGGGPDEITTGVFGYEFATTYVHFVSQMFAGWRGGMRFKINGSSEIEHFRVHRSAGLTNYYSGVPYSDTIVVAASTSQELTAENVQVASINSGMASSTYNARCLEFEVPYATPCRFSTTKRNENTYADFYPSGGTFELVSFTDNNMNLAYYNVYTAASDDFQVFGCIGAPVFYKP